MGYVTGNCRRTIVAATDELSDRALANETERRKLAELALSAFRYSGLDLDAYMKAMGNAWQETQHAGRADLLEFVTELHAQTLRIVGARMAAAWRFAGLEY